MKNQNAIAQIAYIVTADYYTNGKTHIREVENFTTPEEAAKRMTEIIEAAAEHAAQIQRPESVTERHHLTVPRLADLAALPAVHA